MKELWKPIKGYEGYYEVSNLGNIRSVDRLRPYTRLGKTRDRFYPSKLRKPIYQGAVVRIYLHKDGVNTVYEVADLVANAWLPNPNNYKCVAHKDMNKSNNKANNLKWVPYNAITDETGKTVVEEWRPVPIEGYEDLYEISNTGKIRSSPRTVIRTRTWKSCGESKIDIANYKSKEIKPYRTYSDIGNKYHLHKREKSGENGQTDIYVFAYQLVKKAFPELQ